MKVIWISYLAGDGVYSHFIKSPQSGVISCFSLLPPPPRPPPSPPPPPPQWLLVLTSKPFQLNLRYLGHLSLTLTQSHGCGIDKQNFVCLQDKVRTTEQITTKFDTYISLVMLIAWLDFGWILSEIFCQIFFEDFRCVFFKVKHSIGHIWGMAGPIDVERKGGASAGHWVKYMTLTFHLAHDLDFWSRHLITYVIYQNFRISIVLLGWVEIFLI